MSGNRISFTLWGNREVVARVVRQMLDSQGFTEVGFKMNRVDGNSLLEDGGQPRSRQTHGPHATQQGAATPDHGATVQGAAQAAGNVAEPQIGPTPDRSDRPPSSSFIPSRLGKVSITRSGYDPKLGKHVRDPFLEDRGTTRKR